MSSLFLYNLIIFIGLGDIELVVGVYKISNNFEKLFDLKKPSQVYFEQ